MLPLDEEKTIARTSMGTFHYSIMSFGLKNVGEQAMTAIFTIFYMIEDYVGDITIKSKNYIIM